MGRSSETQRRLWEREREIRALHEHWKTENPDAKDEGPMKGFAFFLWVEKNHPEVLDRRQGDPWQEFKARLGMT